MRDIEKDHAAAAKRKISCRAAALSVFFFISGATSLVVGAAYFFGAKLSSQVTSKGAAIFFLVLGVALVAAGVATVVLSYTYSPADEKAEHDAMPGRPGNLLPEGPPSNHLHDRDGPPVSAHPEDVGLGRRDRR